MATEQEQTGRCGWIALGLVLLLLPGLVPGSILGGIMGLKAARFLGLHFEGGDLVMRLVVLLGMIAGLLASAAVLMIGTMALLKVRTQVRTSSSPDSPCRQNVNPPAR